MKDKELKVKVDKYANYLMIFAIEFSGLGKCIQG